MDPNADQNEQKIEVKKATDSPPEEPQTELQPVNSEEKIQPPKPPKQKGEKKKLLLIVGLVVILLGGLAYWWFMMRDNNNTTDTNTTTKNQSQTTQSTNTYTPVNVAYAFKGDNTPYTLYTRPAAGGERVAANQKLETSEYITDSDVNGDSIVLASDKAIYTSTDGGKTYKSVVKVTQGEEITSVKLSSDGKSMVYGFLAGGSTKNIVKTSGLDGSGSKDLFTSEKMGVLITGYSSTKQQIIYRESCWGCDGPAELPILRDLKSNKTTNILSNKEQVEIAEVAVSSDFTTLVYSQATYNATQDEPGYAATAPFTIHKIDLSSNKDSTIATFGTKDEKNPNGTLRFRQVHVGFAAGSSSIYYTDDSKLYLVSADKTSLIYEATKPLLYVPFVGSDTVIAGSGDQTADYKLVNYNYISKKSIDIFSGDNNTVIFGVTTK
jgi:cytoskeletal protein RodZ